MKKLTIPILALFIASVSYAFTDDSNLTLDPLPIKSLSLSSMPKLAPVKSSGTKLETALIEFIDIYKTKGAKSASDFAMIHDIDFSDGQVLVELSLKRRVTTGSLNFNGTNIEIISQSEHFIIVRVPVGQLASFADDMNDVMLARRPHKMIYDVTSEGVGLIGGDVFHNEEFTGEGVKIAVVDGGYSRLSDGQEEGELPANPRIRNFTQDAFESGSVHGAACTEIVYDFVPDADFYLVKVASDADIENAIDYLIEEQVNIATMSLSFPEAFDDYFQGHDPVSNKVSEAFEAGIFYVNSAGNQGQRHYRAEFDDQDHDENVHMFADNVYVNHFGSRPDRIATLAQDTNIWASLAWDDFPESGINYDLYVVFFDAENEEWIQVAESTTEQDGDDLPTEWVSYQAEARGYYGLIVQNNGGADGVDFTLFTSHDLGYRTPAGSTTIPGLSENDFAVGAVYHRGWESDPPELEAFSSRGPTYYSRIKPDISGADGVTSFMYDGNFYGTSSAAPSVAGAAALVLSAQDMTNAELRDWLIAHAEDVGEEGADNEYGYGLCHIELDFDVYGHMDLRWSEEHGFVTGENDDVDTEQSVLDFNAMYDNEVWAGYPFEFPITVLSEGTEALEIDGIEFNGDEVWTVDFEDIVLEPDEEGQLIFTFQAEEPGEYEGTFTIYATTTPNDEPGESLTIRMTAESFDPPRIEIEPREIELDMNADETEELMLSVSNTGQRLLRFTTGVEVPLEHPISMVLDPDEGEVEPDEELEITVTIDATDCVDGVYETAIEFVSNDPSIVSWEDLVYITITVIDAPDIDLRWGEDWGYVADENGNVDVERSIMDFSGLFGGIFSGSAYDVEFEVMNKGTEPLEIGEINLEGDEICTIDPQEFVIDPDEEQVLSIHIEIDEPGEYEGTITFVSNDPDEEELTIRMIAEAIPPPELEFDPQTIEDDLVTGQVETYTIRMTNTGDESFSWHAAIEIIAEPEEERDDQVRSLRSANGSGSPRRDEGGDLIGSFRGINAADEFSSCIGWDADNRRMWVTNYNTGIAAAYTHDANYEEFEEVARIEVGANMDGCWVNGLLYIPEEFRSRSVNRWDEDGENIGTIQFDFEVLGLAADAEEQLLFVMGSVNYPIHVYEINEDNEQGEELGAINNYNHFEMFCGDGLEWVAAHKEAPLWMTDRQGYVHQFAVDRDEWECIDSDEAVEFRVGNIGQYSTVAHDGEYIWASGYGADDIRIYDEGIRDQLWITIEPDEGELEAEAETEIEVTINTHGLIGGDYEVEIMFLTGNDTELGVVTVIMHVIDAPDIDLLWEEEYGFVADEYNDVDVESSVIDFSARFGEDLFSGGPYGFPIQVFNEGGEPLEIEEFVFEGDEMWSVEEEDLELEPDEAYELTITFEAEEPGVYEGVIIFVSNDPNEEELTIMMIAECNEPPGIVIDPQSIEDDLNTGDIEVYQINVSNRGDEPIRFYTETVNEPEGDWFQFELGEVELDPNSDIDIDITINAGGLNDGYYEADILFISVEDEEVIATVNVLIHVTGVPVIEVVWSEENGYPDLIDFGEVFLNNETSLVINVLNVGSTALEVEDITFEDDIGFSVDPHEFVVDPREELAITVSFSAEDYGLYETNIIIISNATNEPELVIPVEASVFDNRPPVIVREIPDIEIDEDAEPFIVADLDEIFSDPDDDELGFNAVSNDGHIDLEIDDENRLYMDVHADWNGVITITVTADDGYRPERDDALQKSNPPLNPPFRKGGEIKRVARATAESPALADCPYILTDKSMIAIDKQECLSYWDGGQACPRPRSGECLSHSVNRKFNPGRDWRTELEFELIVNPINDRPNIVEAPEEIDTNEGARINFDIVVVDIDVISEWDNDSLRFSFLSDDGLVERGAYFEMVDANTGRFIWQTDYDDAGVYVPVIRVQDNFHERDLCAVRINVSNNNRAPVYFAEIPPIEFDEDARVAMVATLNEHFRDPDGGHLNFIVESEGLYTAVNEASQLFIRPHENWNGESCLTITARDNLNQDTCQDILVVVNAVNDRPSIFSLLTPENHALVGTWQNIEFTWEESEDIEDSTIVYTLLIEFNGGGVIERRNINDTRIEIPREWLSYDPAEPRQLQWTVWATDGTDSVHSAERFNLTVRPLSAEEGADLLPTEIVLGPAYPNPFNASVTLDFALPEAGRVVMDVFNINGNLITTINDCEYQAGYHQIVWNGKGIATGIYFCRMRVDGQNMKIIKLVYSR